MTERCPAPELEETAAALEASGEYRVLRRLPQRDRYHDDDGTPTKIGIILDTETTGLDPLKEEVIELCMVKFEFDAAGRIYRVLETFTQLQEPTTPVSAEITKLTGITQEMVAGQAIDAAAVAAFAEPATVVIAHKASFDRRFAERAWEVFRHKAWACSIEQVDWKGEGLAGAQLAYLLMGCGLFHDAHRATDDCRALLEVLSRPLPASGELALKRLLDTARKATIRISALNSPFELKDALKVRGYRWSDGSEGRLKAWWIDVSEDALDAEIAFLHTEIYRRQVELPMTRLTAFERFSERS